jgi:hypothetical protein
MCSINLETTVIVRDKNGCTATLSRDFIYIDICISIISQNGDGNLDEWSGCTNNYLTYLSFF